MFTDKDWDQPQGDYPIWFELGPDWHKIDYDILVRCMCYVGRHAAEITPEATGLEFEVIALRWHHFGAAYPCLAIPSYQEFRPRPNPFDVMNKLEAIFTEFVRMTGLDELSALSAAEPMTWADIHDLGDE